MEDYCEVCGLAFDTCEKNNRDAAPDQLSTCLKCDEVMCGPAFITCAGANRRRCGITSDITRAAAEVCNLTLAV
jgi:hypothetical protein